MKSKALEAHGHGVVSTDLVYRGYGKQEAVDFLKVEGGFDGDIITNPPYKYALEFVEKVLDMVKPGGKVAMFLKLQFLEGKGRKRFFLENPPKTVYVSSSKLLPLAVYCIIVFSVLYFIHTDKGGVSARKIRSYAR